MISLIACIDKIIFRSKLYLLMNLSPQFPLQKIFFMPSFVYSCEKCSTELRFLVSTAFEGQLCVHCPKCNEVRKFKLEREGNVGKDWCSSVLIKNKSFTKEFQNLSKLPINYHLNIIKIYSVYSLHGTLPSYKRFQKSLILS